MRRRADDEGVERRHDNGKDGEGRGESGGDGKKTRGGLGAEKQGLNAADVLWMLAFFCAVAVVAAVFGVYVVVRTSSGASVEGLFEATLDFLGILPPPAHAVPAKAQVVDIVVDVRGVPRKAHFVYALPTYGAGGDGKKGKKGGGDHQEGELPGHWEAPPQGVLLLLHGCTHDAEDFFALPEEWRIVQYALRQDVRLVPVALSSQDRLASRCWDLAYPVAQHQNVDFDVLAQSLPQLLRGLGLEELPLYGFGASSGGFFLTAAASSPALGVGKAVVQIASGVYDSLGSDSYGTPTFWLPMEGDRSWVPFQDIERSHALLQARGVPSVLRPLQPLPLSPTFFSDRIPSRPCGRDAAASAGSPDRCLLMDEALSRALFQHCLDHGFLRADAAPSSSLGQDASSSAPSSSAPSSSFFLREDPRRSGLPGALAKAFAFHDHPLLLASLDEVLNVAYGQHETSSEAMDEWFPWLIS